MNRKHFRKAAGALLITICLSWICCGCQTLQSSTGPTQARLNRVLSGESFFGDRAAQLSLPKGNIFHISPEMREFLKTHIQDTLTDYYKLQELIEAVTDKSQLGWEYDAFKTYNAAESFHYRRGNCISYAIMMVVLGRELGLDLSFNEVYLPSTWDIQTELTVVLFRHVNVLAKVDIRRMVLGLNMEEYDRSFPQHLISDVEAEAHYFNNRGVDYLNTDDVEQAFLQFKKALMLQPDKAFIWGNMGVLYLRHGHYLEAETAFLHALELNPNEITSISNLQRLYVKQGNTKLANKYRKKADNSRLKNPYYRFYLAEKLLDDNQPKAALKNIKWAIARYKKEHRFHFLAAKIYARLGRKDDAEKSLEQAAYLTENENSRLLYESKIARLREISGK